jgi:hypothetical protein
MIATGVSATLHSPAAGAQPLCHVVFYDIHYAFCSYACKLTLCQSSAD